MSRGKDGPEDVDATFAEIVADLRAEGVGLFPDEELEKPAEKPAEKTPRPEQPETEPEPGWRGGGTSWDKTLFEDDPAGPSDDEGHFVPPEPPPLPRPRKGAFIVLLFFVLGLLLLIAPNLIGMGTRLGTPLGILALATAIALLLLRVRQGPPPGADPHNGAQV
ncbi:hypothetical protein SAMN04489729_2369 [Amycolatopsis lurida]|uniref:DUF308 domain-containing protein n=1 Tax=Amycolatopsis lurida NRRL 2430 TaxID=1460371 RepID=A0A2P2FHF2_AMYLU|nr:hypothetical protein [Amycolatopsis lurida]KFU76129.1 hypothetical protein BB31_37935 [Amycolatopsis lurida NRRL 2430]SEC75325.1 hypothetical protein SAMN04489729_2369 [Amycolatopsis lurida]